MLLFIAIKHRKEWDRNWSRCNWERHEHQFIFLLSSNQSYQKATTCKFIYSLTYLVNFPVEVSFSFLDLIRGSQSPSSTWDSFRFGVILLSWQPGLRTSVKFYSVPMQWMFPSGFLKKHKIKSVQSQLLFHQIQRSWTVFCSSWGFRNCHWFLWLMKDWLRYSRLKARLNFRKYNKLFSTTIHFYLLDPIICKQTLFFLIPLFYSRYKVIFSFSSSSFSVYPFKLLF